MRNLTLRVCASCRGGDGRSGGVALGDGSARTCVVGHLRRREGRLGGDDHQQHEPLHRPHEERRVRSLDEAPSKPRAGPRHATRTHLDAKPATLHSSERSGEAATSSRALSSIVCFGFFTVRLWSTSYPTSYCQTVRTLRSTVCTVRLYTVPSTQFLIFLCEVFLAKRNLLVWNSRYP